MRSDYFQAGLAVSRAENSAGWVFDHQQPLCRDLEKKRQLPNEQRLWAEGLRARCEFR